MRKLVIIGRCSLLMLKKCISLMDVCAQLCSLGTCACVWAGVGLRVGRVPLAARVRLLLLAALSSLLLHSALLVLHVTRLAALLPLDWNKLVTSRAPASDPLSRLADTSAPRRARGPARGAPRRCLRAAR